MVHQQMNWRPEHPRGTRIVEVENGFELADAQLTNNEEFLFDQRSPCTTEMGGYRLAS
jgi:hypothetical protein